MAALFEAVQLFLIQVLIVVAVLGGLGIAWCARDWSNSREYYFLFVAGVAGLFVSASLLGWAMRADARIAVGTRAAAIFAAVFLAACLGLAIASMFFNAAVRARCSRLN